MALNKELIKDIMKYVETQEPPQMEAARQIWALGVTEARLHKMKSEMGVSDVTFISIANALRDIEKGILL